MFKESGSSLNEPDSSQRKINEVQDMLMEELNDATSIDITRGHVSIENYDFTQRAKNHYDNVWQQEQ